MTVEEIKAIIDEEEFDVYGLRMDEAEYEIGEETNNSHNWWQDDPEDGSEYDEEIGLWKGEELDGTCAIVVRENIESALERVKMYNHCGKLYLIAGFDWEEGNDIDEVIIRRAKVVLK